MRFCGFGNAFAERLPAAFGARRCGATGPSISPEPPQSCCTMHRHPAEEIKMTRLIRLHRHVGRPGFARPAGPWRGPRSGQPDGAVPRAVAITFHRMGESFLRLDTPHRPGRRNAAGTPPAGRAARCPTSGRRSKARSPGCSARTPRSRGAAGEGPRAAVRHQARGRRAQGRAAVRQSPDPSAGPRSCRAMPSSTRAMAFMKKVWRRLVEMMADLQRDMQRKS